MGGVRLRLTRLGRKKRPFYRIVVADSRARRDGNQIETLGYYDPLAGKDDEKRLKINPERAKIKGSILAFEDISGNSFSTSKGINGSFSGVLGRS